MIVMESDDDSNSVREMMLMRSKISAHKDDDKKFASQAVAFVIKHSCNGFVPLCASVATLLQEQARLKQELKSLQLHIDHLKLSTPLVSSTRENNLSDNEVASPCQNTNHNSSFHASNDYERKNQSIILEDCSCDKCTYITGNSITLSAPIKKGEKAIIRGEICGRVCYVGHVHLDKFPEINVGLQLDEPIGNTNGTVEGRTYFTCPANYGLFVPLSSILCIIADTF